jgi:hypothetical protein
MWPEAEACFAAHRARLRGHGVELRARLEPRAGVLCAYTPGVVGLALPTLDTPDGALRAALLGGLMGLAPAEVDGLFRALLPRLVAHEIGHALRAEAGLLGGDRRAEEQVADRLATLLARPLTADADRRRAAATLGGVTARLGGVDEAAALHRDAAAARAALGLGPVGAAAEARARERLQAEYFRDVEAYLRLTAAWAWIDLTLNLEDDLDAFRHDHLDA